MIRVDPQIDDYMMYDHETAKRITRDIPDTDTSVHVSELSKEDLIVLMQDLRRDNLPVDMEVVAACEKWGIFVHA